VHSPGSIYNQTEKGIKYAVLPSRALAMPGCRADCSELRQLQWRRVEELSVISKHATLWDDFSKIGHKPEN